MEWSQSLIGEETVQKVKRLALESDVREQLGGLRWGRRSSPLQFRPARPRESRTTTPSKAEPIRTYQWSLTFIPKYHRIASAHSISYKLLYVYIYKFK